MSKELHHLEKGHKIQKETRSIVLHIRIKPTELALLKAVAEKEDRSVSKVAGRILMEGIRR